MPTHRLSPLERFTLQTFVREKFTELGLTDSEFAAHATKELGFTVISNTVCNYRTLFKIPATVRRIGGLRSIAEIITILENFEARLNRIETELGIPGLSLPSPPEEKR